MRLEINGTTLYIDVESPALTQEGLAMRERPTLLLLHGGPGFDHTYFTPPPADLAAAAQLVYLDQRGQGRSARAPLETCTIEQMADDAAAVIHTLGLERPTVLGHSHGGFVALTLAIRHPESIGGLILVDTAAASADMAGAMERLEARHGPDVRAAAEPIFRGEASEAAGEAFFRLVAPAYVHDRSKIGQVLEAMGRSFNAPEVAAYYFTHLAGRYDVRDRLGEIRVPALVITGAEDWLIPPSAGEALAADIPGAEFVVIPEAAHFAFIERPDAYVAAVRRFLAAPVPA